MFLHRPIVRAVLRRRSAWTRGRVSGQPLAVREVARQSPSASLRQLVIFAHQRWAIEQQYQELKSELGLDHVEGRSYPGWQHHVVLTAVAHAYIQCERRRRGAAALTFPAVRAIVQEIFTALLFAAKPRYMQWMERAKRNLQLRI